MRTPTDPLGQTAAIPQGNGNTIIQIVGDGNTVIPGRPHLRLTRYLTRRVVRVELDWLSPYCRSTALIGREHELEELQKFLDDPRPTLVRTLAGPAGRGKTRLALELCERASDAGWSAGFATHAELSRFSAQQNLATWGWHKPTLVVVDYAAQHARTLAVWIEELADREDVCAQPLRLLLLEREASLQSGWCAQIFASGSFGDSSKRALLDPPTLVELAPLQADEDRVALMESLRQHIAPGSGSLSSPDRAALGQRLRSIEWAGDPLYVLMAALTDALHGGQPLALRRIDLASDLARREAKRIGGLAGDRGLDPQLVTHLAACVTATQGMSRGAFETFAGEEKHAVHRPSGGDPAALADLLQLALPGHNGIAPILPDLIGEAFVLNCFRDAAGTAATLRCFAHQGLAVAQMAIRCAQDFSPQRPEPLEWLAAIEREIADDEAALVELSASLPARSVVLRTVNLRVTKRLLEVRSRDPDTPTERRADALNDLATAHANVGEHELALQTAQEAVRLYRELTDQQPVIFRHNLAESLRRLSNILERTGQRAPALEAAREAADLYRELVDLRPDVFRPDLAALLDDTVKMLRDDGQYERASQTEQESNDLFRELVAQPTEDLKCTMPGPIGTLARELIESARDEWTLPVIQEGIDIIRTMAAVNPDVLRPQLAETLHHLADTFSQVNELEYETAALPAAREAVDLYRELTALRPDAFRADLAKSLSTLATLLGRQEHHEQALVATQEAVGLYRALAAEHPEVYRSHLATSLHTLANMLGSPDQREHALRAVQEAADIRRALAVLDPAAFRPDLATSLDCVANALSALSRYDPALKVAEEAIAISRALASTQPDTLRSQLATSLQTLANILIGLGRPKSALRAVQEAADIRRALTARSPDPFRPDLAVSLDCLANTLSVLGQYKPALKVAKESVIVCRALASGYPELFRATLAASLNTLANMFTNLGRREHALRTAAESIEILRTLTAVDPEIFRPDLAAALNTLANMHEDLGRPELALQVTQEAVDAHRALAAENPDVYRPHLARSLAALASRTDETGPRKNVHRHFREALRALMPNFKEEPPAFPDLIRDISWKYLQWCAQVQQKPDAALLKAICQSLSAEGTTE
jgi:tetratricopeptide (TPR) repeat protein